MVEVGVVDGLEHMPVLRMLGKAGGQGRHPGPCPGGDERTGGGITVVAVVAAATAVTPVSAITALAGRGRLGDGHLDEGEDDPPPSPGPAAALAGEALVVDGGGVQGRAEAVRQRGGPGGSADGVAADDRSLSASRATRWRRSAAAATRGSKTFSPWP